jgi:hypothetical protein
VDERVLVTAQKNRRRCRHRPDTDGMKERGLRSLAASGL